MGLGEKLFEEKGKVTDMNIESVHPVEGTKVNANFVSDIKGMGKFPSGKNMGSGVINQYPHGIWDASYRGVVTTQDGEQFFWWGHAKSRAGEGWNVRGIVLVTGFTNSQKLAWMNRLILAIETELNQTAQEFAATGFEWK
jgi:hypothetical protein